MLDLYGHVFLGVKVELFGIRLVLKSNGIAGLAVTGLADSKACSKRRCACLAGFVKSSDRGLLDCLKGGRAFFNGLGAQDGLGLVGGKIHRKLFLGMIDRACDHRSVGVTIDVRDNHLVTDTRQKNATPAAACPVLAHAHPARACCIVWAVLIPEKAHPDPS